MIKMHRKVLIITFLFLLSIFSVNAKNRVVTSFNDNWGFYLGEYLRVQDRVNHEIDLNKKLLQYIPVKIPHTWNSNMVWKLDHNQGFYQGIGWYTKDFDVSPEMKEKRVFIRFQGVGVETWVFVNGKEVGYHGGAYSAFCFELTDYLNKGKNRIHVRVSNKDNKDIVPESKHLFPRYGGIYRPINLIVTDKVCITPLDYASKGIYITNLNVSKKQATVKVNTLVSNGSKKDVSVKVVTTLYDELGKKVLEQVALGSIKKGNTSNLQSEKILKKPHLWDGKKDPYLYNALVEVFEDGKLVDSQRDRIGFRTFKIDPEKGAFLNGKYLDIVGTSRHQDWEKEGPALEDWQHEQDVKNLIELGATGVRLAHYQQAQRMYEMCDETGLMCWAEIPLTPWLNDENPKYEKNAEQQLTEIIKQNYNHPSIYIWNIFNEVRPKISTVKALNKLAHGLDSTRYTCNVCNYSPREVGMLSDIVCRNSYPLWYTHDTIGANLFVVQRENYRKYDPKKPFGISEYGAGGDITQHQQHPTAPDPAFGRFFPEEYENEIHEGCWKVLKNQRDIWCKFIWNLNDFGWAGVTRGSRTGLNNKGLLTYDRKTKKDVFFFYKSNWNKDVPTLYITSRRDIERNDSNTDVKVYTNCSNITLFVNGEKISTLKNSDDIKVALWKNITLVKGYNYIKVVGYWNKKKIIDECKWILK